MLLVSRKQISFIPMKKGQAEKTTWPFGRDSPTNCRAADLFSAFRRRRDDNLLVLRTSPNAVTKTAITTIIFKNFNPNRLLSQQVAPVCLGREPRGSNAFLKFFEPRGRRLYFE